MIFLITNTLNKVPLKLNGIEDLRLCIDRVESGPNLDLICPVVKIMQSFVLMQHT